MINLQKPLFKLLTGFLTFTSLIAQETVPASGGNATGSGGSAGYTIGQVAYTQQSPTSGSVSAGVQQAYEITVVNSIAEAKNINLSVKAYPNPTTDFLTLEVKDFEQSTLLFQLFDMSGKLIVSDKVNANSETVNMKNIPSATYFLKIIHNNLEIKTFKIVKL